jgi:FixJ family two-component response regulator
LTKVPVISIVDDDESVRVATKDLVRSLGYATATFSSAEEFLRSSRLDDTACLITDLQMPGMSGLELQRRLLARGCSLPIIFMTAFPEARSRAQALAAGALGFLSKPLDDELLVSYLGEALSEAR